MQRGLQPAVSRGSGAAGAREAEPGSPVARLGLQPVLLRGGGHGLWGCAGGGLGELKSWVTAEQARRGGQSARVAHQSDCCPCSGFSLAIFSIFDLIS